MRRSALCAERRHVTHTLQHASLLKLTLSGITNVHFSEGDLAWTQALLTVKMGGCRIRSTVQLAPSACLASAAATSKLVPYIIPSHLQGSPVP